LSSGLPDAVALLGAGEGALGRVAVGAPVRGAAAGGVTARVAGVAAAGVVAGGVAERAGADAGDELGRDGAVLLDGGVAGVAARTVGAGGLAAGGLAAGGVAAGGVAAGGVAAGGVAARTGATLGDLGVDGGRPGGLTVEGWLRGLRLGAVGCAHAGPCTRPKAMQRARLEDFRRAKERTRFLRRPRPASTRISSCLERRGFYQKRSLSR
jgi:hypothetical protein